MMATFLLKLFNCVEKDKRYINMVPNMLILYFLQYFIKATESISTVGCGETKGCLRSLNNCNGNDCDFVATYTLQPRNLIQFELFGKDSDWVAIGFSDDQSMPNTHSVSCYVVNGRVIIRSAYLRFKSSPSYDEENELDLVNSSATGNIGCRFNYPVLPSSVNLRRLDEKVFLLYAKGKVDSSGSPLRHSTSQSGRGFSQSRVNVTKLSDVTADAPSKLKKKVHGSLMATFWILFASWGLFLARYNRGNWPDTKILGTPVWFQVHRLLMIIVVAGTISSMVVIVEDLDGKITNLGKTAEAHAYIGFIVLCLAVLQPLVALFRPNPESTNRWIFNIFHRLFGFSTFVLAFITVLLGLEIFEENDNKGFYTVIGYGGFLAVVLVTMEISKCFTNQTEQTVVKADDPGGMTMETTIVTNIYHPMLSQVFLVVLSFVSLAVTVTVIYYINDDEDE
ncbi:putative ferric-chelate reductase 1 [Xenia sp. Carnegie-2017]|uniref:putative ferric-chelate reductase 1 n=1 Tax=Xenia sp. Carnegie-2017 TaxID=2897299 RepID=UPI001F048B83|nr:putative ferric-chelate reductase 1 [Xenia sp. Carnegie-2017]